MVSAAVKVLRVYAHFQTFQFSRCPRPGSSETPAVVDLMTVVELDIGDRWVEIDSEPAALYHGLLTQTGIGAFYAQEAKMEGGHPRPWFVLVGPDENGKTIGKVGLCVLPDGVECKDPNWVAPCHTTGFHNKSAYPEFADEIADLAEFTGLPIEPNYMGTRLMQNQVPPARGPRV
jgi:hypothetical protein